MYKKLFGMIGIVKIEEDEFVEIYNMSVIEIFINKLVIREDVKDYFFVIVEEKY